ncbi:hypothetical protein ACFRLW_17715 [Streptomyces sp. NPDC056728]
MNRLEALAKATEHVDKLATTARGYQDGVRFTDKDAAVERLARFLMEDSGPDVVSEPVDPYGFPDLDDR